MPQEPIRRRLLRDREQLVAALHDLEADKAKHLEDTEREAVIDSIKRRIADVNRKLDEIRDL